MESRSRGGVPPWTPCAALLLIICLAAAGWWRARPRPLALVPVDGPGPGSCPVGLQAVARSAAAGAEVVQGWRGEWRREWPPRERVAATLRWVAALARKAPSTPAFLRILRERSRFLAWRWGGGPPGSVLVTGYFVPRIRAARRPSPRFPYPVYGLPRDLVAVDLHRLDPSLPRRRLVLQVRGHGARLYPSRAEIEGGGAAIPAPVLAWLPSAVEGFILQVQGSGRLLLPDGNLTLHYAGTNGRPYRSIGRIMVERGILRAGEVTLPAITRWLRAHPQEAARLLAGNPRYVFFRAGDPAIRGSYRRRLRAMASAALDPRFYPPGALLLLRTRLPHRRGEVVIPLVNLDRGGAIQGPGRIDLFCGEGEGAMALAGGLRARGRLFLVIKEGE